MKKRIIITLVITVLIFTGCDMLGSSSSSDGTNDGTSNGGTVTPPYVANNFEHLADFDSGNSHDSGEDVVVGADGSIYVCGYAKISGNYDMTIWKYKSDGTLDTSFNSVGYVALDSPAGGSVSDFATSIDLDDSGNIVVAGYSNSGSTNHDLVVARYKTDGTLDTSFNSTGYVVIPLAKGNNWWETAVLAEGNRVYVADTSNGEMVLYSFTNSGILDDTFAGGSGFLVQTDGSSVLDMTSDTSGNLLITGKGGVWKVTSSGETDLTFGADGFTSFSSGGVGYSVEVDNSGKILVSGYTVPGTGGYYSAVWRLTASGALDTSFNGSGIITREGDLGKGTEQELAYDLVVDGAGNVIVTGVAFADSLSDNMEMIVWRFDNNGGLDTTFGDDLFPVDGTPDGFYSYGTAANNIDRGKGIAIDSQGRVVICGETYGIDSNMALWRLY